MFRFDQTHTISTISILILSFDISLLWLKVYGSGCGHICTEVPHTYPQSMKAQHLTLLEILAFV